MSESMMTSGQAPPVVLDGAARLRAWRRRNLASGTSGHRPFCQMILISPRCGRDVPARQMAARMPAMTQLLSAAPPPTQGANRKFLGRAGVRQVSGIGAGLPTMGSSRVVAQEVTSERRVVNADIDSVVIFPRARGAARQEPGGLCHAG